MTTTTAVPGTVIHHIPAQTRTYIGSPGLAILPDGSYVASHDLFGPGCTRDQTLVYRSEDGGGTWQQIAEITGQWWSSLFVHHDDVYLFGTTTEYGHCVIRRSTDGGHSWTTPSTEHTGLLRPGRHHTAPVPVILANGRIWRAMEDAEGPGNWGEMFRAFVMHAPEDADLLDAGQWSATEPRGREREWLDGDFGGWLEGNAVQAPDGSLVDVLRVDSLADGREKAALLHVTDSGLDTTFDPATDVVEFPGGAKKFTIRWDPGTRRYLALVNDVPDPANDGLGLKARNTLSLVSSADLRSWVRQHTVLHHPDTRGHAFQYVDWLFEGDDLVLLSRTAYGEGEGAAHNHHDANYLTFHRLPRFRTLLEADAADSEVSRG